MNTQAILGLLHAFRARYSPHFHWQSPPPHPLYRRGSEEVMPEHDYVLELFGAVSRRRRKKWNRLDRLACLQLALLCPRPKNA